jgi:hypothetical protein
MYGTSFFGMQPWMDEVKKSFFIAMFQKQKRLRKGSSTGSPKDRLRGMGCYYVAISAIMCPWISVGTRAVSKNSLIPLTFNARRCFQQKC